MTLGGHSARPIRARLNAMLRRPVVPCKEPSAAKRVPSSRAERYAKKVEEKTLVVETKQPRNPEVSKVPEVPEVPEVSEESSESGEDSLFY